MNRPEVVVFWFRRDLRLKNNVGLNAALTSGFPVLPIFIFDENILGELPKDDARICFIHKQLQQINAELVTKKSSLLCLQGKPLEVWETLITQFNIKKVFVNRDFEPYALQRDKEVKKLFVKTEIHVEGFTDHLLVSPTEVLKNDGTPYTVFTPFSKKWKEVISHKTIEVFTKEGNFFEQNLELPSLKEIGFVSSNIKVEPANYEELHNYALHRDIPSKNSTSFLSPHLRFGTVSIRQIYEEVKEHEPFLNELIWREFFIHILYFFPESVSANFKPKYDGIPWRNNEEEFQKWCDGKTGFPMVDAGMRQLNQTGYMHNRVRMITAGFLCKHLLIDWRWGEAYFAKKLLDFELASNVGNWQWAAGTGCDAAPYFRVFNPSEQQRKFDQQEKYIRKWIPEFGTNLYPKPMVDHKFARERAIETYKNALNE
ncbi:MAG: deoxyribodipyrimidine photo-lyase [Flavobacteriales bacterium]|nr:deoxyribodipyrimidine photo-lyase [Flavobacteriales bacterium]